jgi:RNA polymerase sigma-70 factor (ECF subfamily)
VRDGTLVPLDEQDTALWDHTLVAQGEALLRRAHAFGRIGRFQLEAAIQSVHCARAATGGTDWETLRKLHVALISIAPTLGAQVSLAAVVGRIDGPAAGLAVLDAIPSTDRFQPAWATRAHLLASLERWDDAADAYAKAISLTADPALRRHLTERAAALAR